MPVRFWSVRSIDMWMQENKIANLKIAIKKLDGLVLNSGQTFSYWRQIGKPTRKKGYLEGMVLHNGTVVAGVWWWIMSIIKFALLDYAPHSTNRY